MSAIAHPRPSDKFLFMLATLTYASGGSGMVVSFLYLASSNHLDVAAGAAGFVAGSILVAGGLLALTTLASSARRLAATPAAAERCTAFGPPAVIRRWLEYYRHNRECRPEPAWSAPIVLSTEVVRPLVRSLEQFQLGDGGGPASLIGWDAEQLRASDPQVHELVDLWFAEEREHARLLGGALDRFGGHRIEGHWSFTVFCWVRRTLGVRFELTVLLLTEIVSTVYYRLIRRHGDDQALREMCRLILRDKAGHIAMHRDRLKAAAQFGGASYGLLWEMYFRALGLAAATMLWVNHAPGLRALGASGREFYREVVQELTRFVHRLRSATADGEIDSANARLAVSECSAEPQMP